jgi:hypothetical protein
MLYRILADILVGIHTAYVGFVVVGQLLIWAGLACRWRWVRNPWFRWIHLLMIGIVAVEAGLHLECPLTTWEHRLREAAGEEVYQASFLGQMLHYLLFPELPLWVFPILHIGFAVLVLGTFILAPPRRRRGQETPPSQRAGSVSDGGQRAGSVSDGLANSDGLGNRNPSLTLPAR